ncbi:MAG: hypothetical protein QM776_00060 [Rhodocyclaceae bacterium]
MLEAIRNNRRIVQIVLAIIILPFALFGQKEVVEGIGKENIERNLEALKATNSLELARNYFSQSYFLSFFLTIILSVILRRQPKN